MKFTRAKDAQVTLRAVQKLCLEDLDATSDEQLRNEMIEDGLDPEKINEGMRESLDKVVREFREKHPHS